MSTMLSWVGLAPSAEGDAPELPADSPLLLAGLAAFRRQTQQALSGDEALASAVADPSQSSLMMAKADTGTAQPMTMAAVANSAPVLTGVTQDSPDQSTGTITGAVTATDQDDNPLLYSLSGPQPAGGSVTVNADGTFIYTPSESARLAAGPYSTVTFDRFTVAVGDGQAITTTDVSVPVLPTVLDNEGLGCHRGQSVRCRRGGPLGVCGQSGRQHGDGDRHPDPECVPNDHGGHRADQSGGLPGP